MFRPNWRHVVVAAILLGTIAIAVSPAEAFWGWGCRRPACGVYGTYYTSYSSWRTPYYATSYSPCCYTGGWYVGCRSRLLCRPRCRPYRYCSSSWGWPRGCCGYAVSSDTCCAVEVDRPVTEPTPAPEQPEEPTVAPPAEPESEPAPLVPRPAPLAPQPEPPAPEPGQSSAGEIPDVPNVLIEPEEPEQPAAPAPAAGDSTSGRSSAREDSGVLSISVPAQARVIINGLVTNSTGADRQYVSYGLKPGFVYKYEIRAQIVRDGRLIENTSTVHLAAGAHKGVAFRFDPKPEEAVATLW